MLPMVSNVTELIKLKRIIEVVYDLKKKKI